MRQLALDGEENVLARTQAKDVEHLRTSITGLVPAKVKIPILAHSLALQLSLTALFVTASVYPTRSMGLDPVLRRYRRALWREGHL